MGVIKTAGDKVTVCPTGDVISPVIKDLQSDLQQAVAAEPAEVIFDLGEVKMIDSTGLGLLVATFNSQKRHGGKIKVVNATGHVLDVLLTTQLNRLFEIVRPENK